MSEFEREVKEVEREEEREERVSDLLEDLKFELRTFRARVRELKRDELG